MQEAEIEALRAAIAMLETQRRTLGAGVVELAIAPLRAKLALLRRVPAGLQRRQVTVLFADVVGSTAMAGSMDPEDTLDLLSGSLRRMADVVEAQGGRVLRFTGDGVKAAFGMDEAREDDPERAVRAGLAILQAGREQAEAALRSLGVADFAVRVGVHTGEVALGAGVEADNTAMGAAVNIAARMEQSAPAGGLRISHETWVQVRGLFDAEPQAPLQVKGVEAPMRTYLVHAARERGFDGVERGVPGLQQPMIGREPEQQRLLGAVARARAQQQAQVLTLVGDAGLGKSRLLRETLTVLSSDPEGCLVLAVRCPPDGLLRPWGLLRGLLAARVGISDTDSAEVARSKLVDGLSPGFDEHGERQAQLLGQLAGLDFGDSPYLRGVGPRALRDQAFAALRDWLRALGRRGGLLPVLAVEDLHWADDGSLDLLQHLISRAAELPLALLMTCRPALLARRPGWAADDALVRLAPLSPAQSGAQARSLLQRMEDVPPRLIEAIVGPADGNPYYVEELVRRLVDDGVIAVDGPRWSLREDRLQGMRLPGTLVGLLQARLDALPAAERHAARQASVIGHVFWDDALRAIDAQAPQALPSLQRAAFVRAHDASSVEGTAERQFDHHLLHQVTYETLLKAERRAGHGAAARWLAERTRGWGAQFLAMTGEHAERAGDIAMAVDCFDRAAAEARNRFANDAAVAWLRRAVGLLGETEPGRRFDLLYRVQVIADTVGDRAAQDRVHAELAALLDRHPDDARQAQLHFSMALLSDRRSDTAGSEHHSRLAFELAERAGAAQIAAGAQSNLAWLQVQRQDYPAASAHLVLGLRWAARIEAHRQRLDREAQLLMVSGLVAMQTCRFDEARDALMSALARGEELGMPRLQLSALNILAVATASVGRWEESAAWGERTGVLARSVGAQPDLSESRLRQALAAQALGDAALALRLHEENLEPLRTIGDRRTEANTRRHIGVLHLERGDTEAALPWLTGAREMHQALGDALEVHELAAYRALCEAREGRIDSARAVVDELLDPLHADLAARPGHTTIELRWICQRVLDAAQDPRAAGVLERLHDDVQARAAELTDPADRERLIAALPVFRSVAGAMAGA